MYLKYVYICKFVSLKTFLFLLTFSIWIINHVGKIKWKALKVKKIKNNNVIRKKKKLNGNVIIKYIIQCIFNGFLMT